MKRKGNEIIFDSARQKAEFEGTMAASHEEFLRKLMSVAASLQAERSRVWNNIIEELKSMGELADNESLSYDWMSRKLKVEEMAKPLRKE